MRTKLGQNVEEMLQRDDVLGKLDHLREITSKTQQPPGHQAWRPNGNPEDSMAALDLQRPLIESGRTSIEYRGGADGDEAECTTEERGVEPGGP